MTGTGDDPFKNRPEDFLNRGLKTAISALPIIGGPASEFFAFVVGDPAQERRDDFMRQTFEQLESLTSCFEQLDAEALRDNEQFQATVVQAVRISASTASGEKKQLLRNAILNSAVGSIDENVRHVFMIMIEQFTPLHIVMLRFLSDPQGNAAYVQAVKGLMAGGMPISSALPELTANKPMFARVTEDLSRYGCSSNPSFNVMMSGGESMLQKMSTPFGDAFLQFVIEPSSVMKK